MRQKSTSQKRWIAALIVTFIVGTAVGYVYAFYAPVSFTPAMERSAMSLVPTAGFENVRVDASGETIILSSECRQLSFDVTPDQAFSIALALQGQTHSRPLTHDLMNDALKHYDAHVIAAHIDDSVDGIYTAKLYVSRVDEVLKIDARPSDALALGLRNGVPIMVSSQILDDFGEKTC